MEEMLMKQLVYGGILMITGMLGILISLLLLYFFVEVMNTSIPLLIFFAATVLFVIMVIAAYIEHVRPAMKDKDAE